VISFPQHGFLVERGASSGIKALGDLTAAQCGAHIFLVINGAIASSAGGEAQRTTSCYVAASVWFIPQHGFLVQEGACAGTEACTGLSAGSADFTSTTGF